jgi:flagellar biosynthesis/type III secretory pathway protein FliH
VDTAPTDNPKPPTDGAEAEAPVIEASVTSARLRLLYQRPALPGAGVGSPADPLRRAEQVLSEARMQAERLRAAAERESREAGYAAGLRQGLADTAEVAARFHAALQSALDGLEADVLALVRRIAAEVVGAELAQRPEAVADVVRTALAAVRNRRSVTVCVHGDDLPLLEPRRAELAEPLSRAGELRLRRDDSVPRGGCRIETEVGVLDARIDTQLDLIVRALGAAGR